MIRRCRPSLYGHNLLISKGYLCSIKETKHDDNKIPKLKIKKHGESKSQEHHVDFATSGPGLKAMNVTKIGALANLGLAISKGTIGFSIASTGLIADAANSLGDLLSDAVVYYSVTEARKRATPDRPWGRGKIEPLGALSVGGLLVLTGLGIGYSAVLAAIDAASVSQMIPQEYFKLLESGDVIGGMTDYFNQTAGNTGSETINGNSLTDKIGSIANAELLTPEKLHSMNMNIYAGLAISGASIVAKELLFRYTLQAGKAAHSDAVIANAWQHRSDVSTSSAVFVGLIGGMLGYPLLDPIAGMLVAGVITRQGALTIMDSLRDLSDAPASERETDTLKTTCLKVKGVIAVTEIKARKSGPYLYVEVTIDVDGIISASAAHRIAELTRRELLHHHNPRVANVVVHVNPLGSSGLGENSPLWARDHDYIVSEIKLAAKSVQEVVSVSEVQIYYKDNGEISSKLDIVLSPTLTIQQAHAIAVKTRKAIEIVLPGMKDIDVDLELDETL